MNKVILFLAAIFLITSFSSADAGVLKKFLYPGANREAKRPSYAVKGFVNHKFKFDAKNELVLRGKKFDDSYTGKIVLFFHGNAGVFYNGDHIQNTFNKRLPEDSVRVYSLQYPGYAGSSVAPTEATLKKAALIALDLLNKKYPTNEKILFGFSLGSAVAVQAAVSTSVKYQKVIINSPWKSFKKVCYSSAIIFGPLFCYSKKHAYKTAKIIKDVKAPVIIFHGKRDRIIPHSNGEAVFEALQKANRNYDDEFHLVKKKHHNDLYTGEVIDQITSLLN